MIQARTGSKRFPRKVLAKIKNKPMIWHVINRAKKVSNVQQIILVTTKRKEDKILLGLAERLRVKAFAGHTYDVLARYYNCASKFNADPIIRITGDCPLIDPTIINKMLKFYLENDYDYVCNIMNPTYPDGLDVEIFSFNVLEKINKLSKMKSEREHVTPFIRKNLQKFRTFNYKNDMDLSNFRWTVDEKKDLKFVSKIYSKFGSKLVFTMKEILQVLLENPEISEINKGIVRNEGYLKSIKNDKKITK
jgi:spore coat polysaccharide biosynthesis protein SpsF (cytidylyltransferase family)